MDELTIGLIVTGGQLVAVFLGVRVFAAAALAGLVGMVWLIGWKAGAGIVGTVPHSKSINYVLSVLPMFILIGFVAYHAGLTHALFNAARAWVGMGAGRARGRERVRNGRLRGGIGSEHRDRGGVQPGRDPAHARERLQPAARGRGGRGGRHPSPPSSLRARSSSSTRSSSRNRSAP